MRSHVTRHRATRAFAALAVLAGMMAVTEPASAVHDSVFELEGNVADDGGSGAPFDWETFFDSTGGRILPRPAGFLDSGFDADHEFPDRSTFTGGSKDTLDISGWSCTDSNNLGGKFDILNAYSTIYEDPSTRDLLLFFGIERAATEGDGNMGFWFLKDGSVDCAKPVGQTGKAPAFTGNHVDGDIFVVAGFSNGGTQATVTAYRWNGGANGALDTNNPFVSGARCTSSTHNACGIVNTGELVTPWPSPDKNGGNLDANAFYEGFVRVPAANVSGCFATFVANTRSSTSPTATIHDFSRGSFPTCAPSTELKLKEYKVNGGTAVTPNSATPSTITVYKGDSLELFFAEKNDGNLVLEKPTSGKLVVIPNSAQSSACSLDDVLVSGVNIGDTDGDNKIDPGETWVYKCTISISDTTPATFVAYGHGIDALTAPPAKKDVTFCTSTVSDNPALHPATTRTCDADERTTVNLNILAPSTRMFASATLDIIFYEENDGGAPLTRPGDGDYVRQVGTVCDTIGPVVQPAGGTHPGRNVGDTDGDDVLDPGEKWQWKCTVTLGGPTATSGTKTAEAIGHGISGIFDVTFCTNTTTADQPAKLGDNITPATALCDPHERRKVTLTIE